MLVPVMQIRLMRMLVGNRGMGMQMAMPFAFRNRLLMGMIMVPVVVAVIMDVFHGPVGMQMIVRINIRSHHSHCQQSHREDMNPLEGIGKKQVGQEYSP
jgi:hypothetical protein